MPTRTTGKLTQDWEPMILSRRKPTAGAVKDPKAVNQALRAGAAVETVKKFDAGERAEVRRKRGRDRLRWRSYQRKDAVGG
ncbi:multiprotein-bridging factor 1c-like [Curcuma longa]|uniref:multiprotein-bridging factor 1c-like n=1 Tax=Curcuma longa TaxID=136217 RepID=UPI003D9F1599